MTRILTPTTIAAVLADFSATLGVHLVTADNGEPALLGIADSEGHQAIASLHPAFTRTVLTALSSRQVWAWDSVSLVRALGFPWFELCDAETALDLLDPQFDANGKMLRHPRPDDAAALVPLAAAWSDYAGAAPATASEALSLASTTFPLSDARLQAATIGHARALLSRVMAAKAAASAEAWGTALVEVDVQRRFRPRMAAGINANFPALESNAECADDAIAEAQATLDAHARGELVDTTHRTVGQQVKHALAERADFTEYKSLVKKVQAGRFYPRLRVVGARTHRMTVSGVAMQKVPAGARDVFTSDSSEHVLLSCDLPRIEVSWAAYLSQDPDMIAACQPGRDPYIELAQHIWGPEAVITKTLRHRAKRALLAPMYGQGVPALAAELGIDVSMASALVSQTHAAWPVYTAWAANVRSGSGPIRNLYGRELPAPQSPHKRVNYTVQSTAAAHFKTLILSLDDQLRAHGIQDALWMAVHDEVVLHVHKSQLEGASLVLAGVFGSPIGAIAIEPKIVAHGEFWSKDHDDSPQAIVTRRIA